MEYIAQINTSTLYTIFAVATGVIGSSLVASIIVYFDLYNKVKSIWLDFSGLSIRISYCEKLKEFKKDVYGLTNGYIDQKLPTAFVPFSAVLEQETYGKASQIYYSDLRAIRNISLICFIMIIAFWTLSFLESNASILKEHYGVINVDTQIVELFTDESKNSQSNVASILSKWATGKFCGYIYAILITLLLMNMITSFVVFSLLISLIIKVHGRTSELLNNEINLTNRFT